MDYFHRDALVLSEEPVDEEAKALFLREADNTEALHHPHVVRTDDYGYWNGIFFLLMEYCAGGDVTGLMRRRGGTLPVEEALDIVLQALDGLDYAHGVEVPVMLADSAIQSARGLVHRDVSPQNILLAGGVAKLADFGLAKAFRTAGMSDRTRTRIEAGKPEFMPRQQLLNFKYAGPEVDVWAMAACLYYMLTRYFPRDFPRREDPWPIVLESTPVPIRKRDRSIPKGLAEVIDAALIEQPEIHFKTAANLRSALERAL